MPATKVFVYSVVRWEQKMWVSKVKENWGKFSDENEKKKGTCSDELLNAKEGVRERKMFPFSLFQL